MQLSRAPLLAYLKTNSLSLITNIMSKPIFLHLLLLTLACHLTNQYHKFVTADEQLIQVECHNANVPEICMQCLRSDPHSQNANQVGIAEIIVGCMSKHANNLLANVTVLYFSTKGDAFKMLQECAESLSSTDTYLTRAMLELRNGKYDSAEHSVAHALLSEENCEYIFERYKSHLPTTLIYETKVYEELSEAASRIIERL